LSIDHQIGLEETPICWDLAPVALDADEVGADVEAACRRFAVRYRERIGSLSPEELAEALAELARIRGALVHLTGVAWLRVAVNVDGAAERAARARADGVAAGAEELLRFFELEWLALPESRVEELCAAPPVAHAAHLLRSMRRFAPYVLSEPEERALATREAGAFEAWLALYEQIVWTVELELEGRPVAVHEAISYLWHPDRDLRRTALRELHRALEPHADVVAHCYDTVVADRLALDELRGYESPRAERDLDNELPAEVVDTMLAELDGHAGLVRRWYERKAELLGLPRLAIFDEYAPLGAAEEISFGEARATIERAFADLDPELGDLARAFFEEGRIDAEPRPGRDGNAFCLPLGPGQPSYALVSYTQKADDVRQLAHELGHGVHYALAGAAQDALTYEAPPAVAEIAATFTELLVASRLVEREPDPAGRRALVAANLESSLRAVFHAGAFHRFETTAYETRAAGELLTAAGLAELWLGAHEPYYGDALDLSAEYGHVWMVIPQFVEARFYVYSYVFSQLLVLALHARREEIGARFVEFLRYGGSRSPLEQLAGLGLDPTRRETWRLGFAELERLLARAAE
jgi:oligoendopeptidase F